VRRSYKGAAQSAQLTQSLGGSTANQTIYCDDLTNWPTGSSTGDQPFFVVIDRGKASEEKILCVSRSANIITVYDDGITNGRAFDDTSITTHSANSIIEHIFTAIDANEANAHVNTSPLHITVCTSSTRPASPTANQTILETDSKMMLSYINGIWEPVSSNEGGMNPLLLIGA
jgi:hypothetical protein